MTASKTKASVKQGQRRLLVVGLTAGCVIGLAILVRSCAPISGALSFAVSQTYEELMPFSVWAQRNRKWLTGTSAGTELEALARGLMDEYDDRATGLPEAPFSNGGRELPLELLPVKFQERGGAYHEPQLFLRLDAQSKPEVLVISWGHLREAIMVFREPPTTPPRGTLVERATGRIFVVVNES